jgi:hypothetical protein
VNAPDDKMKRADSTVERAAGKLQQTANRVAAQGGLRAKLAPTLADDAAFVRKLKPSLIAARAKGRAPADAKPGEGVVAPSGPQLGKRPRGSGRGPNPFVVIGAAFAAGMVLAKVVDWRSHAHPRF